MHSNAAFNFTPTLNAAALSVAGIPVPGGQGDHHCILLHPLISMGFTYMHIWAALYMTFYPIGFIGCYRFLGPTLASPRIKGNHSVQGRENGQDGSEANDREGERRTGPRGKRQ